MTPWPFETAIHTPTLLAVAVGVMLVVAAIMSLFGLIQRTYRGYRWWAVAMWLAPIGAALVALRDAWPWIVAPGVLLLLAWPLLVVTGLRRFFVRDAQFAGPSTDVLVYGACFGTWLVLWFGAVPLGTRAAVYAGCMLVLHLYAALVIARLGTASRSHALRMLVGVMVALGIVPLARVLWIVAMAGGDFATHSLLSFGIVLPLTVAMLCTVCLCLVLMHERTVDDLRETQRQLRVLADIDMLTQVPNRRRVEELAQRMAGRTNVAPTVLMLFDIDHFKRINDTRGHAAGDEALRIVARCSRETLRTRDVLGRIGGDEFMLLLPGATVDHALQIADRITRRLDAQRAAIGMPLSLSFGVVQFEPGEAMESAQRRADQALYEAKRQGRRRAVPAEVKGRHTVFGESKPLGLDPLQPV